MAETGIFDEELSKERKSEIALQLIKYLIRTKMTFNDWATVERKIGNLVKERELEAKNISKDELMEFGDIIVREVFEELKNH